MRIMGIGAEGAQSASRCTSRHRSAENSRCECSSDLEQYPSRGEIMNSAASLAVSKIYMKNFSN